MSLAQMPDSIEAIQMMAQKLESDGHPNPMLRRRQWMNLGGVWQFRPDPEDRGLTEHWYASGDFSDAIVVPYAPMTEQSGIPVSPGGIFWYRRGLEIPSQWFNQRIILHFGAVDYEAMVFINGDLIGQHQGGYTPFAWDIRDAVLSRGANDVVVRVVDLGQDLAKPRGKQTWHEQPEGILYTPTSGIWQPVWLEPRPAQALVSVDVNPDPASGHVEFTVEFAAPLPADGASRLTAQVEAEGRVVGQLEARVSGLKTSAAMVVQDTASSLAGVHYWSPDDPYLYTVRFQLEGPTGVVDAVESYFGFRTVETTADGTLRLNGSPLYLKMLLDQGYFPKSGLTGSDEQFRQDILLVKAMGFNGVRKHQKIEDPRFLYWCDRLGLLVWEEMPSAYTFDPLAVRRLTREWLEVLQRDQGHPSIVAWVPFNESWGVPELGTDGRQRAYAQALYQLTKAVDPTRWVIANDGWEHVVTDLITIHDYQQDPAMLDAQYHTRDAALACTPAGRKVLISDALESANLPILLTEFGGMIVQSADSGGWGYGSLPSADQLQQTLSAMLAAIGRSAVLQGYCYTQFTDVEQEQNGLTTIDRVPKIPIAEIRRANQSAGAHNSATPSNRSDA